MKQFDGGEDKDKPPQDSKDSKLEGDDELESKCESSSTEQGRLVIDDTRSCYVSNVMWTSLSDEVRWR